MRKNNQANIAVLGDGGWGTTLAMHLYRLGHDLKWWGAFPEYAKEVNRRKENRNFLPGIRIPSGLCLSVDLADAVNSSEIIVLAVPSEHMCSISGRLSDFSLKSKILVSVAKGVESSNLKRMSEVILEQAGKASIAVLSGPNIASEIAKGHPASSVVASNDTSVARKIQRLFASSALRVYTSCDVTGVELGGALKNPIAIAAGICDGLGLGTNAKAALMTRGIVEMSRLGVAMGAKEETFWGLSGLGDLVTTCMGGRNRWLGEQIGRGKKLSQVLSSTKMVIEGVNTTKAAVSLGRRYRVEMPIIDQVYSVLFRGKDPRSALRDLMLRSSKPERHSKHRL